MSVSLERPLGWKVPSRMGLHLAMRGVPPRGFRLRNLWTDIKFN